ncbi:helix-turn-helix domain-containing protein [Variovorax ginsengisoli]
MVTATAPKTRSRPKKTPRVPNPLTIAMGQNLRRIRKASGKTQVMLAFEAEVERSRISKLECGYINPSLLTLGSICYCLGTTLSVLFEGITETVPPSSKGGPLRRSNQAVLEKAPSKARSGP